MKLSALFYQSHPWLGFRLFVQSRASMWFKREAAVYLSEKFTAIAGSATVVSSLQSQRPLHKKSDTTGFSRVEFQFLARNDFG